MKRSTILELKENLLEHHDYEAVSKFIFRYLKKWYGVDYEIIRFLKMDPVAPSQLYLELYPGILNFFLKTKQVKFFIFLEKNNLNRSKLSKSLTPLRKRYASNKSYEDSRFPNNTINLTTYTHYDTISDMRMFTPSGAETSSLLSKSPISKK